jgi:hypothetical protein
MRRDTAADPATGHDAGECLRPLARLLLRLARKKCESGDPSRSEAGRRVSGSTKPPARPGTGPFPGEPTREG